MHSNSLDKSIFCVLLAILIFLPLPAGGNRAMYYATFEVLIFLLFAACVINLKSFPRPRFSLTAPVWPIVLLAATSTWILLQAIGLSDFRSIDIHVTLSQLSKTLTYAALFILCVTVVNSPGRLRLLAWTLLISGTLQAMYGTLNAITEQVSATGTYINRNHLAGYLEMTLAIGIGLLIADLDQGSFSSWRANLRGWIDALLGPKARVRVCLVLMVTALILTHSRMGNIAFFASLMFGGVFGLIVFRRSSRGLVLLFTSLIIIDTVLMGAFFGLDQLQERIAETSVMDREVRTELAMLNAGIVEESFWTGTGVGTYYSAFPGIRDRTISESYIHAHNDYMEFLSEFGAIGFAPLVLLVGLALYAAIQVQIRRRSQLMRAMGFAAMMAIVEISLHSIVDFNLQIPANAATFSVILALPYIAATVGRGSNEAPRPP